MSALLYPPRSFMFHAPNHWEEGTTATHALEVLAWGEDLPPDAPTVLCVHGLTRNAYDFQWLASKLCSTHRIYAISMAGRGGSARLKEVFHYNYGTYVQDCMALIGQLKLTQLDWIGTSMGGIIGMMVAANAPALIRTLTINDIGNLVPASALNRIYAYAGVAHNFTTHSACEDYLRSVLQPWGIPDSAWKELLARSIMQLPDGQFSPNCDPDILAAVKFTTEDFTKVEDVSLHGFWEKITCPILLLHGLESDILPLEVAQDMASSPHVTYQPYAGIGHAPSLMEDTHIQFIKHWLEHHPK